MERNLLIEAGAGTGKTTRLVKAVLQALFIRQLPLESIVALTFTNKAAGELKERVGSALDDVLSARSIDDLRLKPWWPGDTITHSLSDLQKLAAEARSVLDRANISTIHSFAFALLKRFPLAAGIDPKAEIDDKGLRFDELFRREWPAWLAVELSDAPPREAQWTELLSKLTLSEVEEAARRLADFEAPLDVLVQSEKDLPARLKGLHAEIRALIAEHGGNLKADQVARASEEVIGSFSSPRPKNPSFPAVSGGEPMGPPPVAVGDDDKNLAAGKDDINNDLRDVLDQPLSSTKAWPDADIARLKKFQKIAQNLIAGGDRVIALLTEAIAPFVSRFRDVLLTEGCLTHSALLYLSREIVRHHPEIRAALKRSIRFILIDEFQDTDPLQAELLLYLAEMEGRHAADWQKVMLAPGKLFIVGDPKQSIYRFRGADIAAYERIGKLLVAQGGLQETLETNYRSQSQVIKLVNRAFEKIIKPEPEISPPYIAVQPHHPHAPEHAVQDVEVWLADSPEEQSVEEAQATEAEAAARWIEESVNTLRVASSEFRAGSKTRNPEPETRNALQYKDIALIFRTYSPMDRFIEALRRRDIPFAVESERYFFTTPEVTDFVNLLRAAADPDDLLSLVGYLRSPMGGLTDEEILRLRNSNLLSSSPAASGGGPITPQAKHALAFINEIHQRLGRQSLSEVLQYIFENTFILEMAVRSYHGDQTVANLLKLRRLLEAFAAEGVTTMGLLLQKLEEFFNDDKIEGESPLADENYNAVRLLTIHKAKGLEFPVVFLPSLHSSLVSRPSELFIYDWRTQKLGLKAGAFCNLDKLLLDEQTRRREAAEENRILYVAMTRARERLVLSGGVHLKSNKKRTYLQRLLEAWELVLDDLSTARVTLGDTSLSVRRLDRVTVSAEAAKKPETTAFQGIDPKEFAKTWKARAEKRKVAEETILVTTPSGISAIGYELSAIRYDESLSPLTPLTAKKQNIADSGYRIADRSSALLGTLIHRFLEQWDFTCEKCSMPAKLRHVANAYFAQKGLLREPFKDPKEGETSNNPPELIAVVDEAQRLLADFIGSEAWEEIKNSEILGREIPFFYRTNPMMRGTIDILYKLPSGQIVIGDYKTGLTKQDYAAQSAAYQEAVRLALGVEAVFKIIQLREEDAVPR